MATSKDAVQVEKSETAVASNEPYDVIIVGAGAAGVGAAIAVLHTGVENFLLVDREGVLSLIHI